MKIINKKEIKDVKLMIKNNKLYKEEKKDYLLKMFLNNISINIIILLSIIVLLIMHFFIVLHYFHIH